jgi:hypothetical protein
MVYSNVDNTYLFKAGLYMCTTHHQLNGCNITLIGELDIAAIPQSIINISRPDNNCSFSLRNCTALYKDLKITHNMVGIATRVHNNLTKIRFLNCIIYRYGSGYICCLSNGGFVYFESFGVHKIFFILDYIFF